MMTAVRAGTAMDGRARRPTWATVVGVLGIIFGCLGILGAGQEMLMPRMMDMQKEMFSDMQTAAEHHHNAAAIDQKSAESGPQAGEAAFSIEMFAMFNRMFDHPDWFGPWSIAAGTAKALISAVYLLAAIWLLQLKTISIRLFYAAAGSRIALGAVNCAVGIYALSFMGIAMTFGGVFGAIIDLVLIIVVATGSKAAFAPADIADVSE